MNVQRRLLPMSSTSTSYCNCYAAMTHLPRHNFIAANSTHCPYFLRALVHCLILKIGQTNQALSLSNSFAKQ